jgi:hypothetical protein
VPNHGLQEFKSDFTGMTPFHVNLRDFPRTRRPAKAQFLAELLKGGIGHKESASFNSCCQDFESVPHCWFSVPSFFSRVRPTPGPWR